MKKLLFISLMGLASIASAGPGLADGAAKFVGNITTRGQVRSDFTKLWNQITAENECKWQSIEGSRGNYNWSGCDYAYNWAKNNGGHFKFHALVWGSQYPNWLNGLSTDETKKAITAWFDAVAARYPDLEMIDVVNEAIRTGNNQYHSGYGSNNNIIPALGGDNNGDYNFVTTAFKMARERWPNAILIYNDYNTVQWQKNEGIQLIQTIKKNGAPVDAYGLQAHDMMTQGGGAGGVGGGGGCLSISTLRSVLDEIWQKTEMPMFISEYDIFTTDDNTQKKCYEEQISLFMENEHVAGITLWGYIYGATWNDGTSGIIRENGQDRPAMTWLKEYLASNKGVNTTGLVGGEGYVPPEPEPQTPFKGSPLVIPGKIEIEDFDIPGKGTNEDGSKNTSYSDADSENHGNSDYRKETGVDLYEKATGVVAGYNNNDDWLEYTVDIAEAGEYTVYAAVSAAGSGTGFDLYLDVDTKDEKKLTSSMVEVPAATSGTDNYDEYNKVSTKVTLPAGKHILRFYVTKEYFDIDYLTFVKGDGTDPEPIDGNTQFVQNIQMNSPVLGRYDIFDMQGVFMGRISAYSASDAATMLKGSSEFRHSGNFYLRNRATGKMEQFRVVR